MSRQVLYIDDNDDNLAIVRRVLARNPDITLRTASTGREGLAAAASDPPGLILLDLHLPDLTGVQVLRQLLATPATFGVPVVILSGDSSQETADAMRAEGAAGFITKPMNIHELLRSVVSYLG
jgi:CheY-like chemotaxis protein